MGNHSLSMSRCVSLCGAVRSSLVDRRSLVSLGVGRSGYRSRRGGKDRLLAWSSIRRALGNKIPVPKKAIDREAGRGCRTQQASGREKSACREFEAGTGRTRDETRRDEEAGPARMQSAGKERADLPLPSTRPKLRHGDGGRHPGRFNENCLNPDVSGCSAVASWCSGLQWCCGCCGPG